MAYSLVAARAVVVIASALQFIGLLMQWPKIKWLSLYVPALEACTYFVAILLPDGGSVELTSGTKLPLLKYSGWMVTVPVLLIQLTRLPMRFTNRSERTSQLIVENQMMLVLGLAAATLGNSLPGAVLFVIACSFGLALYVHVFAIYKLCAQEMGRTDIAAKRSLRMLFGIFYLSWSMFPIAQLLESNLEMISDEASLTIHVIADLLSKNTFGLLFYYYVWRLKPSLGTTPVTQERAPQKVESRASFDSEFAFGQQVDSNDVKMRDIRQVQLEFERHGHQPSPNQLHAHGPSLQEQFQLFLQRQGMQNAPLPSDDMVPSTSSGSLSQDRMVDTSPHNAPAVDCAYPQPPYSSVAPNRRVHEAMVSQAGGLDANFRAVSPPRARVPMLQDFSQSQTVQSSSPQLSRGASFPSAVV